MKNRVDVIMTSTGRPDLLRRTLESFTHFNTYDIERFWINDDYFGDNDNIVREIFGIAEEFPFVSISAGMHPSNQIVSLDFLWNQCREKYVFTLEDDWEFLRPGFIEESMDILEKYPACSHVWLQDNFNHHKVASTVTKNGPINMVMAGNNPFYGFTFSPSLRRLEDYKIIGSYGQHTTFDPLHPSKIEMAIGEVYNRMGFWSAATNFPYIRHLGAGRTVMP